MDLNTQGKLVDRIFDKVNHLFPEVAPDDLRQIIYKKMKQKNVSRKKVSDELKKELTEGLIANVKPRNFTQNKIPFGVARNIVRKIRNDYA